MSIDLSHEEKAGEGRIPAPEIDLNEFVRNRGIISLFLSAAKDMSFPSLRQDESTISNSWREYQHN